MSALEVYKSLRCAGLVCLVAAGPERAEVWHLPSRLIESAASSVSDRRRQ